MAGLFTVKETLDSIQPYSGDPRKLDCFLHEVENAFKVIATKSPNENDRLVILGIVRNKIIGDADTKLTGKTFIQWRTLKEELINIFKEHRDENTLRRQLFDLEYKNLKLETLYNEMMDIYSCFCARVDAGQLDNVGKTALKNNFESDTVAVFIRCLREPLRTQVATQNFNSIVDAYDYILNKTDVMRKDKQVPKMQNLNNNFNRPSRPSFRQTPPQRYNTPISRPIFTPRTNPEFMPFRMHRPNPFPRFQHHFTPPTPTSTPRSRFQAARGRGSTPSFSNSRFDVSYNEKQQPRNHFLGQGQDKDPPIK